MTQFHKRGLFDIRDTTIEYCETSNDVKTCREYNGKILGDYFYDIANRPFYTSCVAGNSMDNLLRCSIYSRNYSPVCSGENWHLFNFEDAHLWKDNLGEIITNDDNIVLEWDGQYDFEVATRYTQNKHYSKRTDRLTYKCVLKL